MATFTPVPFVLASLPDFPGLGESLEFQLAGLVVVFTALGLLWGLLEVMGLAFRTSAKLVKRPVVPECQVHSGGTVPAPSPESQLSDVARAAVISAVFVVCEGRPHRITAITPVDSSVDWAREGRRAIFASHQVH
jgi:hypothetical protein